MSVKTITTIVVAGAPAARMVRQIERRRGVRAKVEWLLSLEPSEPPVMRHATVYEPWHVTTAVRDYVELIYGAPPIYSPVAYDAFMMPSERTSSEVSSAVTKAGWRREVWPALAPVVEAMWLRDRFPRVAIFTIVKPVNVSLGDDDFDAAPAWSRLR